MHCETQEHTGDIGFSRQNIRKKRNNNNDAKTNYKKISVHIIPDQVVY